MAGCHDVVGKDGRHQHLDVGKLKSVQCENVVSDMTVEMQRLETYAPWTSMINSRQLATAGFIYTGVADKVECRSCGIRLYNWQEDEEPLQAHKKYAPDCEFMMTNFPDVKAPNKPMTVNFTHYADYEARLKSFESWPLICAAQKPEMMARSGFFYIGSADRARCFHCGVTLRDWNTDDYPPCAHREWSKHCPFVQQLDIDSLKAEIEDWEREEKLRTEFEHSTVTGPGDPPGDHVLGDRFLDERGSAWARSNSDTLDERGSAWARSNSDTLDADLHTAREIFLHGKCNGNTALEHGRDAASFS